MVDIRVNVELVVKNLLEIKEHGHVRHVLTRRIQMNKLIEALQEVIDRKSDNQDLKIELSGLVKMLKIGFQTKTAGMEKIPKIYSSNDAEKIKKFYDSFGTQIQALKITGNFDLFADYLKITYGINIEFTSETSPNIQYIKKPKKLQKFSDLYTHYFLSDTPREAKEAVEKILLSLDKLTKEFNNENDLVKETLKDIIEGQTEHSPATVKTVDKILTQARIKSLKVEDVASDVEDKLNLQQQGIDIVLNDQLTQGE